MDGSRPMMDCARVVRDEIAEQYVAGRLNEADAAAFERHYFGCARCFEELEAWRVMRSATDRTAGAGPVTASVSRRWIWPAAAAAAVLIGVVGYQLRSPGAPEPGAIAPTVTLTSAEALTARLTELSAVTPVPYRPARLRGASDEAMRRFQEAMTRYEAGEYAAAAEGLEAAANVDAKLPPIQFYLGLCYLLTNDPDRAVEHLAGAIALGQSAYLEEAQFHLAKAYMRRGDLAAARSALTATIALAGDREAEARQLLDKLAELDPRGGRRP